MPEEQTSSSVWMSSSVVVFLLIASICCMLSLSSSKEIHHGGGGTHSTPIRIPNYIPNIAMLVVMSIGIAAMVVFVCKRAHLTVGEQEHQLVGRHNLHSKFSLWSITAFFIGYCTLDINYLVVEISCADRWTRCDHDEMEIFLDNVVEVAFHVACVAFSICETVVCWTMKRVSFKSSQWVWHGLAVVQAANVALWFDSVLEESQHRINENADSFDAYFSFCNPTSANGSHSETDDEWCSDWSIAARWFVLSIPFLFPITIEFSLLVSETFLHKSIGAESPSSTERAGQGASVSHRENQIHRLRSLTEAPDERTPLLQRRRSENSTSENTPGSLNSSRSQIFIIISIVINIVYLVLTILVFVGNKSNQLPQITHELQTYDNVFTLYSVLYDLFSIICCAAGITLCRRFRRQHSHTSFLEYLLLFATSGVLLQSIKRIIALGVNGETSDWISAYYMVEVLDIVQALLQIVFYYYAKDVKLQLTDDGGHADSLRRLAVFKNIVVVIAITNFATWISDSFVLPEMGASVTPSSYVIQQWPVFDNVVTPITIFFRFNSALLFWCIDTDVVRPGEFHHED